MVSKTDWLIEQQIAPYFNLLFALTKTGLLKGSPAVSMDKDEEAIADDLASDVETVCTRQSRKRNLAKFKRRLRERVQMILGYKKCRPLHLTFLSN